jgi:hypothetical protein
MLVMVSVGFSVCGDVGDLGGLGVSGDGRVEDGEETVGEVDAAVEEAFEGYGAGGWAVVEEDGDGSAFVKTDEVGVGGVDGGVGGFDPGLLVVGCWLLVAGEKSDAGALGGSEEGEFDSLLSEEVEDGAIDGGF